MAKNFSPFKSPKGFALGAIGGNKKSARYGLPLPSVANKTQHHKSDRAGESEVD